MRRKHWKLAVLMTLLAVMLCAAVYARKTKEKDQRPSPAQVERKVTEAEVPAAALATLKKLAAGAKITEFAEEIEHGHTFYEGSWQAPSTGQTDVLVTPTGDLVEIEVQVAAKQVPEAVRKAARKAAGKGTKLAFEKKTMVLYEVRFSKADSRHELLLTPDGRCVEQELEKVKRGDDDNDKDVSIDDASKAVKVTILRHAADGEIEEIECEDEVGHGVYEVGVIVDGRKMELKVDADGNVVTKQNEADDDDEGDDDKANDDEDEDEKDDCDEDDS